MAKMLPPYVPDDVQSNAERKLFVRMRNELADDWIVLHSLGIADHAKKPWAELDFVLVGPTGVFCLEVKGGRVARKDGVWEFIDRGNHVSTKSEGPFEQVGSAAPQLHRLLDQHDLGAVVVGYGVATPDVRFNVSGPDIEPRIVYDAGDAERSFVAYVDRLSEYWHARIGRGRPASLSAGSRARIVALLRPDFDLRPSLRSRIHDVKRELLRLTEEQYRVLDGLVDARRVLIRGDAGTGKTLLAREEAVRQARAGRRVLLCCFNAALADYLRAGLVDDSRVEVVHIHGFMASLVREANLQSRLAGVEGSDLFTTRYPELALEALIALERIGAYDVLIVDEGQDLIINAYMDVFDALLKGSLKDGTWRVFFDPRQDIYHTVNESAWERLAAGFNFRLSVNCRNTHPIATTASLLAGSAPSAVLRAEGPDVDILWYRDTAHELRELGRMLGRLTGRERVDPENIVVLTRRRFENTGLTNRLPDCPFSLRAPAAGAARFIRHSTIAAFKGLEADVVVVADLDDLLSTEAAMLNYVGSSRACGLLLLAIPEKLKSEFEDLGRRFGAILAQTTAGQSVQ